MNLRFEGDALRFRVSSAELATLLSSGTLAASTVLPAGPFRYAVQLTDTDSWALLGELQSLLLCLPRAEVLAHSQALPSRSGLEHRVDTRSGAVDVHFEVDIKRPRAV